VSYSNLTKQALVAHIVHIGTSSFISDLPTGLFLYTSLFLFRFTTVLIHNSLSFSLPA